MLIKKIVSAVSVCLTLAIVGTTVATPLLNPVETVSAKPRKKKKKPAVDKIPELYFVDEKDWSEEYITLNLYRIYDYIEKYQKVLGAVSFSETATDWRCFELDPCLPGTEKDKKLGIDKCFAEVIYKYAKKIGFNYKQTIYDGIVPYPDDYIFPIHRVIMGGKFVDIIYGLDREKNVSAAWAFPESGSGTLRRRCFTTRDLIQREMKKQKKIDAKRLKKAEKIDPGETIEVPISLNTTATVNKREYVKNTVKCVRDGYIVERPPLVLPNNDYESDMRLRVLDYARLYGDSLNFISYWGEYYRGWDNLFEDDLALFEEAFENVDSVYITLTLFGAYEFRDPRFAHLLPIDKEYKNDPLKRRKVEYQNTTVELTVGSESVGGYGVTILSPIEEDYNHQRIKYIREI